MPRLAPLDDQRPHTTPGVSTMQLSGALIQKRTRPGCAEKPTLGPAHDHPSPARVMLLFHVKRRRSSGATAADITLGQL